MTTRQIGDLLKDPKYAGIINAGDQYTCKLKLYSNLARTLAVS